MRSKENEYNFNIIIIQVTLSTGEGFRVIEKLIAMPVVRSRGRRSLWAEGQQGHQVRGWQEVGRRRRRAHAASPDRRTPPWENVGTLIDFSPHTLPYPTVFSCFWLFGLFWFFDPPDWHLGYKIPPPTWSAWSGSSAPRWGAPGWAGLAAGEREDGGNHG